MTEQIYDYSSIQYSFVQFKFIETSKSRLNRVLCVSVRADGIEWAVDSPLSLFLTLSLHRVNSTWYSREGAVLRILYHFSLPLTLPPFLLLLLKAESPLTPLSLPHPLSPPYHSIDSTSHSVWQPSRLHSCPLYSDAREE